MVKVDGVDVNITKELQELLLQNPPKKVKKSVIDRNRDDKGDLVHKKNEDGELMYSDAVVDTHPFVYFDAYGNYYLRAFRSLVSEGKEILVTNPKIKTDPKSNSYGKGLVSHREIIPGSELWDNGSDANMQHREAICKGDPLTKIVKVMTRDEVLKIDLKPTGTNLMAQFANLSDAEKAVIKEQLNKEEE